MVAMLICLTLFTATACSVVTTESEITYKDGDTILRTAKLSEGWNYVPEKEGYKFEGWFIDQELLNPQVGIPSETCNLYAKWSVLVFEVKFYDSKGNILQVGGKDSQQVEYNNAAIAPEVPMLEGKEFLGWSAEFDHIKSNLEIYPRYKNSAEIEKVKLQFLDLEGNTIMEKEMEKGSNIFVFANTANEKIEENIPNGFLFDTWCIDEAKQNAAIIDDQTTIEQDQVYYPRLRLAPISVTSVTADKPVFGYTPDSVVTLSALFNRTENINYTMKWYIKQNNTLVPIDSESDTLTLNGLEVGQYTYVFELVANVAGMTVVSATSEVSVVVENGVLSGITAQDASFVYDATNHNIELSGILAGDKVSYRLQGEEEFVEELSVINAGEYKIEYKVERANYDTFISSSATKLTINKAMLTIKPVVADMVYGDDMAKPSYEIESGLVGNDDASVVSGVAIFSYTEKPSVGEHTISILSGLTAANYNIQYNTSTFHVTKRDLSVKVNNASVVYGEATPQFDTEIVGFASGESLANINGTLTFDTAYKQGSCVGEYEITVSGLSSDNYNIVFSAGTLNVTKRMARLVVQDKAITYGDNVEYTAQAVDMYGEDNIGVVQNIAYECDYVAGSNVGTYIIRLADGYKALNYDFEVTAGVLTVGKKDLTIVAASPANINYGSEVEALSFEIKGAIEQDIEKLQNDIVVNTDYVVGSPVGTYIVQTSIDSQKVDTYTQNYNIGYIAKDFQVLPVDLTINAQNKQVTYGDIAPNYSVTYSGWTAGDSEKKNDFTGALSVTSSYKQGSNVGEYDIVPSGLSSKNYIIKYVAAKLNVAPKDMTITAVAPTNVIYGDQVELASENVSIEGVFAKDNASLMSDIQLSTTYTESAVGNFEINVSTKSVWNNYNIVFVGAKFDVAPRVITISKSASIMYNLKGWSVTAQELTQGKLVAGDQASGTLTINPIQAGNTYIASGKEMGEFVWNDFAITKGEIDVTKCYDINYDIEINVTECSINHSAHSYNGIYDAKEHSITINELEDGSVVEYSTDEQTYSMTNPTFSNVGKYKVYYRITNAGRQVFGNAQVVITKANVVVSVATPSAITYGDQAPIFQTNVTGVLGGDIEAIKASVVTSTTYEVGNNVGSYDIGAKIENIDQFSNYNIEFKSAKLVVNKKHLTVRVNDLSVEYGSALAGEAVTYEGFIAGEDEKALDGSLDYNTDYVVGSGVNGIYTIEATGLTSLNYEIDFVQGKVNVTKKAVTLTADNISIIYGGTPTYTYTATGLYGNDSKEVFNGVELTCDYVVGANVGDYTITISGAVADNYVPIFESGTLNVSARDAQVLVNNKNAKFGSNVKFDSQIEGLIGSDSLNIKYICEYAVGKDVGTYTIVASVASNANYNIQVINGTLTIVAKEVAVVWEKADSYTYNKADQSADVKAYFVDINEEKVYCNVTFAGQGESFSNAGNYSATAHSPSANYVFVGNTTSLEMNKANYSDFVPEPLTGVYAPSQTLADIEGGANYKWQNPTIVPTCNITSYKTVFNSDPANYNDIVLDRSLVLSKAVATLQTNIFEFDYSANNTYTINPVVMYNGAPLNAELYSIKYNGASSWKLAGTFKSGIEIIADNYQLGDSDNNVYVKVKSVKIGNVYYTIEDAIHTAVKGKVMIVTANTSFADESIKAAIYNDISYYTIKAGAELLVPYDANYSKVQNEVIEAATALGNSYVVLTIPKAITLEVNGILNVNAKRSVSGTAAQGHTGGNYGQITMQAGSKINVNSGATLSCNGYIIGEGNVEAKNGSTIFDVLAIKDWKGGVRSNSAKDKGLFPFNRFTIQNIEVATKVDFGAKLNARYYISTSVAKPNEVLNIIGAKALFEVASTDGYIVKDLDEKTNKLKIDIYGQISTNDISIKVGGTISAITINTADFDFPLAGNYAITIHTGSIINLGSKFKFLPGSSFVVEEGATANIKKGAKASFYGEGFAFANDSDKSSTVIVEYNGKGFINQTRIKVLPYTSINDKVVCDINGDVNVEAGGSFGGNISNSKNTGKLVLNGNANWNVATSTDITSANKFSATLTVSSVTFKPMGLMNGVSTNLTNGTYLADGNGGWNRQ